MPELAPPPLHFIVRETVDDHTVAAVTTSDSRFKSLVAVGKM